MTSSPDHSGPCGDAGRREREEEPPELYSWRANDCILFLKGQVETFRRARRKVWKHHF